MRKQEKCPQQTWHLNVSNVTVTLLVDADSSYKLGHCQYSKGFPALLA